MSQPTLPSVSLQLSVNRFARALEVPSRLLTLHPRRQGNPGNFAALAPAVTLGVISAFEGFVEDFVATALYLQGQSLAHIAKAVGALNNPDLSKFEELLTKQVGVNAQDVGVGFSVTGFDAPPAGSTWWRSSDRTWSDATSEASGWMQVRHCLTHGLTSGWRAEYWPEPLGRKTPSSRSASSVLRQTAAQQHTLVLHGAITCARIYVEGGLHLAEMAADHLGQDLDFSRVPDFPLEPYAA